MGDYVVEYHCSQSCGQKPGAEEVMVYSTEHDDKLEQYGKIIEQEKEKTKDSSLSDKASKQLDTALKKLVYVFLAKRECPKCNKPRRIASLQTKLDYHRAKSLTLVAQILDKDNSLKRCMYHTTGRALGESKIPDIKAVNWIAPYLHEFEKVEFDEDIWGFAMSDMLGFDFCQTGLDRNNTLSTCEDATKEVLANRDGTVGFFVTLKEKGFSTEAKKGKLEDFVGLEVFNNDLGGHAIYIECVKKGSTVTKAVYDNENREDTGQIALKFKAHSIYICYGEVNQRPLGTKVRAQLLKLATAT